MTPRAPGARDAGQAFPVYVVAVAGLLFVALAVFAVGMAGAARNGARSAADASALAAAQSYRDEVFAGFLRDLGTADAGRRWLTGLGDPPRAACSEAARLAGSNDADDERCRITAGPGPATSFEVTARTRKAVGTSVVPGTEDVHARATARAVLEPRCRPGPGDVPHAGPFLLECDDGRELTVDPGHPDPLLDAKDLFAVRLAATDQ
ncbi:pilus assembly protein TadG-related protein [Streptomyces luteireticuli]|uniref:pilus assembly protein TadG-related protein n=1 Tax=Streptomyces luteireticuli TaxID=173858 RepID=UPI003557FD94